MDMFDETALSQERRLELLQISKRAATHMKRLVADLLDAVRIQSGRLTLDYESVSLGSLVGQAEEMCRPMAIERGIALEAHVADRGRTLRADRARMQQVLGNLLGNAMKFTPPGGSVVLEAGVEREKVIFRVRDTGVGIAADRLPHVFDQFHNRRPQCGIKDRVQTPCDEIGAVVLRHRVPSPNAHHRHAVESTDPAAGVRLPKGG